MYGTEESPTVPLREMPFREAAERIWNPDESSGEHLYLMEQNQNGMSSLAQVYPELADDFSLPPVIDPRRVLQINLWVGSRGNITPLHFDTARNFLAQIVGRKRLTLFPPEQSHWLYPNYSRSKTTLTTSQVNLMAPDLARFPEFANARSIECVIDPGEILFLPPYWWHQVESLDTAVSINFWWQPHLFNFMNPMGLQTIYASHDAGILPNAFETADLTGFDNLLDVARFCLDRGYRCAAALIAKAAVDREYSARTAEAAEVLASWQALIDRAQAGDDTQVADEEVSALLCHVHQRLACLQGAINRTR